MRRGIVYFGYLFCLADKNFLLTSSLDSKLKCFMIKNFFGKSLELKLDKNEQDVERMIVLDDQHVLCQLVRSK